MPQYTEAEVQKVVAVLNRLARRVTPIEDYGWPHPPLNVLDCVLSLNRRYEGFVVPRVEDFARRHPDIVRLRHLLELIDQYKTPLKFSVSELDYYHEERAETIRGVVQYLINEQRMYEGSTEAERLRQWATSVTHREYRTVGVRGFGLAGFQYLRMLFGARPPNPTNASRFSCALFLIAVSAISRHSICLRKQRPVLDSRCAMWTVPSGPCCQEPTPALSRLPSWCSRDTAKVTLVG